METLFCERWWLSKKKPVGLMDEKAAALLHETRQPYTAVLSENGQTLYTVKLANEWVSVYFFDELLRPYLYYAFEEKTKSRLFLKTAIHWEYENESDEETSVKTFTFAENGEIFIVDDNKQTGGVRELQTRNSVEENWDDYPAFGQYMSLCREER